MPKMPKMLEEFVTDDISILCLESFDFIEDKTIFEYPNDNLGITGKLILDCYTGICHKIIYHKKTRHYCNNHLFFLCYDIDESWYEPRENIEHYCSEQCYETDKVECDCKEPYDEKGICQRNMDDTYKEGKVCFDYNTIHFWKGKKYIVLKKNIFTYLENAILKDEECPEGTKNCGIIDNDNNELCIKKKWNCPINYISENKLSDEYSSVLIGNKTFYYGNDNTTKRKIIAGLVVDSDLLLNKDNDEKDIIDNYTISGLLEDNKNLYKDVGLTYDPYEIDNIDSKGNSYLRIFYNQDVNLFSLRETRSYLLFNHRLNKRALDSINYKTKVITILGLIALGYLLLVFFIILYNQHSYFKKDYYGHCEKYNYGCVIIIFLGLMITPLIFGCINIKKTNNAINFDRNKDYSTFKNLNIAFIIMGFALFLFLIVYIILVPVKCGFKEPIVKKPNIEPNETSNTDVNDMK